MAEPTLAQVFGAQVAQDSSILYIHKDDLASVGLVPADPNTAESLFAAIVALAQQTLTDDNQVNNADQSIVVENNLDNLTTRNNVTYRRKSKTITFDKADTSSAFDPNDY